MRRDAEVRSWRGQNTVGQVFELLACGGRLARDFVAAGFDILQYNTSSRNSTTRASRTLQSTRTRTPLERDHV